MKNILMSSLEVFFFLSDFQIFYLFWQAYLLRHHCLKVAAIYFFLIQNTVTSERIAKENSMFFFILGGLSSPFKQLNPIIRFVSVWEK